MPSSIGAPRQRNTDAEKAALKEGHIPQDWTDKPARLAQKDRDARWTLKRAKARKAKNDGTKSKVEIALPVFGYKELDCLLGSALARLRRTARSA